MFMAVIWCAKVASPSRTCSGRLVSCEASTYEDDDQGAERSLHKQRWHEVKQAVHKRNLDRNDAALVGQAEEDNDQLSQQQEQGRGAVTHAGHLFREPSCHQGSDGKGNKNPAVLPVK